MKISAKRKDTGKWWTFGNLRTNQWGNKQVSFKKTPELEQFLRDFLEDDEKQWLNFSCFDDDSNGKNKLTGEPVKTSSAKEQFPQELDDDLPF